MLSIAIYILCIGILVQRGCSEVPICDTGTYIIVMRDEYDTDQEMEYVVNAMEIMSPDAEPMRVTRNLIPTIIGEMSIDAATMASNMRSVAYIECDQIVTRTDAEVDRDNDGRVIITPQALNGFVFADLALTEFTNAPPVKNISGAGSLDDTDRYNLDAIDEDCYECNDGTYKPKYTGKGVDVYILDTGIRYDHNDFLDPSLSETRAGYGGYDAVDEFQRQNQRGVDCNGHGTHCAGIATGRVSGVAKEAKVYSVRVLNCDSFGGFNGIIHALEFVLERHRENLQKPVGEYKGSVVSMSLAGPVVRSANEAVCRLVAAGVVVVTASGNFRRDACNYSPGSAGCHINVGAHYYTERDTDTCIKDVYWFTSRTTSPGFNYGRCVHIMAPGQYVVSSSYLDRQRTISMSGTSMACPHVAGACALLLDQFPRATPDEIRSLLIDKSCSDIDERRMHPSLRRLTPNRRLRIRRRSPDEPGPGTDPPTTPAPTTPTQTTTTTLSPSTVPPVCTARCMFSTLSNPTIGARFVRIRSFNTHLGFLLTSSFRSRNYVPKKVSTATDKNGENPIWTIIEDQVDSIFDYRIHLGPSFGSIGIPFEQIEDVARSYGEEFAINTIIPFRDDKVFLVLHKRSDCNDNTFIQVDYTLRSGPSELVDPITYNNLLGDMATFDVSFTPGIPRVYVHNTPKRTHGANCDCQTTINLSNQLLLNLRNTRIERNLIIVDVNSYYISGNLLFTVTLCNTDCFTGRGCINSVDDNVLVDDMDEDNYQIRIAGMKAARYEIIDLAPYYNEDNRLNFVGVFIRVS
ncbi:Proteinase T-like [Oopsacas minuta]|uniref:Proteinase T-like n=1 Tax=Oopsacas minuta TaxID=111878 RepID=A0AAV7JLJ6_9METZ|nr:Proteinase T-like [Oopsacas minuta]